MGANHDFGVVGRIKAEMKPGKKKLDRNLSMDAARIVEAAAIACYGFIGRGDEKAADQAAVDAMRGALNELDIDGLVVIGEGERDDAPMLYIGERVGTGRGQRVDIALDPLEGATLAAKAMSNALAVVAFAPAGGLLKAPDTYMDKIAIGPGYAHGLVDLDQTPAENVRALAAAKGVKPSEIRVCVLDRPRHEKIIASVRSVDARVLLITDGDVAGVINTTDPETKVDLYMGQGGAPEGVLACAALKCVGGQFQGRLVFRNDEERTRARRLGLSDQALGRKYELDEMVTGDAVFAAAGVTTGALLEGVRLSGGMISTHALVMTSATRTRREIRMRRPI
jgi:fructose-1,6-bisphosphatase II / sedoheptulose-1,7-bisphosphatase